MACPGEVEVTFFKSPKDGSDDAILDEKLLQSSFLDGVLTAPKLLAVAAQ